MHGNRGDAYRVGHTHWSPMATTSLHIGNLAFQTTEEELRTLFSGYGDVAAVRIAMDRESGRPRGFAFIEMQTAAQADAAVQALNQQDLGGRAIRVGVARPRT
jgi:cold-inducible RNA-binding protein